MTVTRTDPVCVHYPQNQGAFPEWQVSIDFSPQADGLLIKAGSLIYQEAHEPHGTHTASPA